MANQSANSGWWTWSLKKKTLVLSLAVLIIVALGVGLGVGLGIGLKHHHGKSSGNALTNTGGIGGSNTTIKWQPVAGTKWQIELLNPLNDTSVDAPVYDIDMFDNSVMVISDLQNKGRKVICYFSAGTYENWRPDASDFHTSDFGNNLPDWSGEWWLNTNSENVREVMKARLDLAKKKGCDGVDPDNIDAYDNSNGLGLTRADAINYVNFLAKEADARGLAIGLKNGGEIIGSVIDNMQWCVNEQCAQYDECAMFDSFIQANKPVFHIEYPKPDGINNNNAVTPKQRSAACNAANEKGFSTVIKNMNLDNWVEYCNFARAYRNYRLLIRRTHEARELANKFLKENGTRMPTLRLFPRDYRDITAIHTLGLRYQVPSRWDVAKSKGTGVIHYAAHKPVKESIRQPLNYYANNVSGW